MKKIGLILVVAALGVAGYVLVSRYCAMSESGNVVIQNKKNPFAKTNKDSANAFKKVGGAVGAPKSGANNTACDTNDDCNSNHCIAGMCQPATTAMCDKHTDCQKDEYCEAARCHNRVQKGEWCVTKGMHGDEVINASCITGNCSGDSYHGWECS